MLTEKSAEKRLPTPLPRPSLFGNSIDFQPLQPEPAEIVQ